MKRFMILATAAFLSTAAFAQTAIVEIAPEQRMKIKQYVTTQKVAPVTVKERVTVGATLPADVRLQPVPADWGPSVTKYHYIYSDDRVVLVEPSTRKVITVIDNARWRQKAGALETARRFFCRDHAAARKLHSHGEGPPQTESISGASTIHRAGHRYRCPGSRRAHRRAGLSPLPQLRRSGLPRASLLS